MSDGDLLLKVLGFVILVGNVITAWAILSGKGKSPQPFKVSTDHEPVSKPDFEKQITEVWQVLNGLRRELAGVNVNLKGVETARHANGEKLDTMEETLGEVRDLVNQQAGTLHLLLQRKEGRS